MHRCDLRRSEAGERLGNTRRLAVRRAVRRPAGRRAPAQARQFIEHTAGDPLGLAYRVMIMSGCRRAELCGFRWSFADMEVAYPDPETGEERQGVELAVKRPIL